ncbi:helix-turn-helix domain-containing protein [Rhodococcus globerulus]|uniref:TetR/AcrR family transcriptional regulator n=1 Tax=Rhodococcus globerulus TaxID=33008 RepID=UPI003018FF83
MEQQRRRPQERSRLTRLRILDTAVEVLVDEGYSQATTLRIQERAGVSRGSLLHHFPSRDALLVAAVHHLASDRVQNAGSDTVWPVDPGARVAAAVRAMWATYRQPYFWASVELWIAARSHDELRQVLAPRERELGALVREATDGFFGPDLVTNAGYPALREILNTSMRGVAVTYAFEQREPNSDPHVSDWIDVARSILIA